MFSFILSLYEAVCVLAFIGFCIRWGFWIWDTLAQIHKDRKARRSGEPDTETEP